MRRLLFLVVATTIGISVVSVTTGSSSTKARAPRVGGTAQIGPVCFMKDKVTVQTNRGDRFSLGGLARFIKENQTCVNQGEVRRVIQVPVRVKISRKDFIGPPGPKGAAGAKGDTGLTGAKGDTGTTGATGATGSKGDTGAQGLMGLQGVMGVQGIQGAVGPIGPLGPVGPKGATGLTGPMGVAGPKGTTGIQGIQGVKGTTGAQGIQGVAGPAGAIGPIGPKGATGAQGIQGPIGPKGPTGAIGSLETVTGGTTTGDKQFTVTCPAGKQAISGGYNIQGSVTASYRSDATGNPSGTNAWTIIQTSGANLSGTAFVYCA